MTERIEIHVSDGLLNLPRPSRRHYRRAGSRRGCDRAGPRPPGL